MEPRPKIIAGGEGRGEHAKVRTHGRFKKGISNSGDPQETLEWVLSCDCSGSSNRHSKHVIYTK